MPLASERHYFIFLRDISSRNAVCLTSFTLFAIRRQGGISIPQKMMKNGVKRFR
jgi:hypothetical protein